MQKYIGLLKENSLFKGFKEQEILTILPCVEGRIESYKNGAPVVLAGEIMEKIGILVEGELSVSESDEDGGNGLLSKLTLGDVFGCAFITKELYPATVYAPKQAKVLFLAYSKIITTCSSACAFHRKLINNLIKTVASKLVHTQTKLGLLHKKSIRAKLTSYFRQCAVKENPFSLAYGRGELARYIGADRSAMYRELKKMEAEKLIEIKGQSIRWYEP